MDRTFVTTPDANGNLDLLTDEDGSPTDYGGWHAFAVLRVSMLFA